MFPLHSGSQAVSRSPEPGAICSSKTDHARDVKTHFLSVSFSLITPQRIEFEFIFFFFFPKRNGNNLHLFPVYLGMTHLRGLDVLQKWEENA